MYRINVNDVRLKLSSHSKNKRIASKSVDQLNKEDSDEYELGQDMKEEKKRKM